MDIYGDAGLRFEMARFVELNAKRPRFQANIEVCGAAEDATSDAAAAGAGFRVDGEHGNGDGRG